MAKKIRISENYNNNDHSENLNETLKKGKGFNIVIIVILIIILLIVLTVISVNFLFKTGEDRKNNSEEKNTTTTINLGEYEQPEDCVYVIDNNVKKIKITAESSAGVGDVFSKNIAKLEYRIKDNKPGDIFEVVETYHGDESRYECDEDWYVIKLSDGTNGYIWGGYKSQYVDILE